MEPKQAYDKIGLESILLDSAYRTIDGTGRVLPPSNQVFTTISDLMTKIGSKITPKHVHTIINNNRNGFKDRIMAFFDIQSQAESFSMDESNSFSHDKSVESEDLKTINLVISPQKWKTIQPIEKRYGKRFYWKLRTGWADVVAEAMWVQHHLSCVFTSKNNTVNKSTISRYYLTFDGHCAECGAKIRGTLLKEPANDIDVIIKLTIEGMQLSAHTGEKRRQLRGVRRQRVADSLIDTRKDAISWRRKEAARLKQLGDKNPPILPSNAVLRKAKEQRLMEAYGLEFSNPALNLLKNAEHDKYVGCIHHISLYKFNCVYWRPEQLQIYSARCRKDQNAQFIIDATGGVAKRDQSHDPHIFLYQCVLMTEDGSVPVFQMVSADQRSLTVAHFLRLILAANAPIPPIVVTDFGWALLIAVAEIFGKCASFADYLDKCYDALLNKNAQLPSTFMRLDICHLSAMVSRWACLKDSKLVGRFYKRCIAQASKIDNLDELSHFFESMLIVALSKYVGRGTDDNPLPSELRQRLLYSKIKGEPYPDEEESDALLEDNDVCADVCADDFNKGNRGWKSWGEDIFNRAREAAIASSNGEVINACYNEKFAAKLRKHLLPYVPLWTAVMVPIFGRGATTATSAAVESEFGDLKHREFKGELPMRVDRFVLQHLERIDEKLKERCKESDVLQATPNVSGVSLLQDIEESPEENSASGSKSKNLDQSNPDTPVATTSQLLLDKISADNEWSVKEEWRGLVKNEKTILSEPKYDQPESKRRKPSYLDDCPDWDFVKNAHASRIPMLLNGSTLQPVRLLGHEWNVTETCSFDAIFQIVLNGLVLNKTYQESTQCSLLKLANDVGGVKKILKCHYTSRAEILSNVYFLRGSMQKFDRKLHRLVARCNAAHLAQTLFDSEPSVKVEANCNTCTDLKSVRKYSLLDVNVDFILCGGLQQMQKAVDDCASITRTCSKCANHMAVSAEYGPHLVIDTSIITDPGYPNHDRIIKHTLGSITKTINVGGKTYLLTGVVGYIAEMSHYVAYALAGQFWHIYDDLHKKRNQVKGETQMVPHLIVYTINK